MQGRLRGKDFADAYGLVGGSGSSLEVCKDYELRQDWVEMLPSGELRPVFYVEPRYEWEDRAAWRYYDPLQKRPDLFLEFARLAEKDRSNPNEMALDWARQYGLLGSSRGYYRDRHTFERYAAATHEYVDHFFEEVDRAAAVLGFYEASLNRDEDAIRPLLERFPTWPVDLFAAYFGSDMERYYGGELGFALYLVTHEVVRMVDAFAYPKLTLQPGSSLPSSLSSGYGFFNLLGACTCRCTGSSPPARSTSPAAGTAANWLI